MNNEQPAVSGEGEGMTDDQIRMVALRRIADAIADVLAEADGDEISFDDLFGYVCGAMEMDHDATPADAIEALRWFAIPTAADPLAGDE